MKLQKAERKPRYKMMYDNKNLDCNACCFLIDGCDEVMIPCGKWERQDNCNVYFVELK